MNKWHRILLHTLYIASRDGFQQLLSNAKIYQYCLNCNQNSAKATKATNGQNDKYDKNQEN